MNKRDKQATAPPNNNSNNHNNNNNRRFPFTDQYLGKLGGRSHLLKILRAVSWQRCTLLATGIMGNFYYGNKQDVKVKVT